MSYSDDLKDPRWQKIRLKVMDRDGWKCRACEDEGTTLNVHHVKYEGDKPWDTSEDMLITLCENCHEVWHKTKTGPSIIARAAFGLEKSVKMYAQELEEWRRMFYALVESPDMMRQILPLSEELRALPNMYQKDDPQYVVDLHKRSLIKRQMRELISPRTK